MTAEIVVEVGKRFASLTGVDDGPGRQFADELAARMATTCARLGIALAPVAAVRIGDTDEAVRVRIDGRLRRCPQALALLVSQGVVRDEPLAMPAASWADRLAHDLADDDDARRAEAVSVLAAVAHRIIDEAADALIGERFAARVLDAAAELAFALPMSRHRLAAVLRGAVAHGVSLADQPRLMRAIADGIGRGLDDDELGELVVRRMRRRRVRVEASAEYLERVTGVVVDGVLRDDDPMLGDGVGKTVGMLRDGLYYELGVRTPAVEFAAAADLRDTQVRIVVGDAAPSLRPGLRAGRVLVASTVEELKQQRIEAVPAHNPATGRRLAIMAAADDNGTLGSTWDLTDYLVLTIADEVRRHAHVLVDADVVERELVTLNAGFPTLVSAALERLPMAYLAGVMRALACEHVTLRNLRAVLEALLADDPLDVDPHSERCRDIGRGVAVARVAMREHVFHQYAQNGTLSGHAIDRALEDELVAVVEAERRGRGAEAEAWCERIRTVVAAALGSIGERTPVIVTPAELRPHLKRLMQDVCPDLAVLAWEELPTGTGAVKLATLAATGASA